MQFQPGQHIHIVGVGGFGMSAIARILLERDFVVSGSDRSNNMLTDALKRDGATIYTGHDASHLHDADMVIATSAVPDDHVELTAARQAGIPVYRRRDILAPLMHGQQVVAVAGTHGKTTTTSMIVHVLREAGLDPSYIVGGVMPGTGTNAGVGSGDVFVIEADEYGHMFLGLEPDIAVLTSLEYDHPDFFKSEQLMMDVFRQFLETVPAHAPLIACADYPQIHTLLSSIDHPFDVMLYSIVNHQQAGIRADNIQLSPEGTRFDVRLITGGAVDANAGSVRLGLPGRHNVQNALAALAVVDRLGVFFPVAASALGMFRSTGRRFEVRGERDGVLVVDDYAHHPTAISTTIEAARAYYPDREIWAVWQPHMYSRTRELIGDYARAFSGADHVLVTSVYAAREAPLPGVTGEWASGYIQHDDVRYSGSLDETIALLRQQLKPNSVVLIMSAGDAPRIGAALLEER
ncbi:MAG: UDP-N-acetylmuramate--L-alanine ligase [Chloroflexota bacterium]